MRGLTVVVRGVVAAVLCCAAAAAGAAAPGGAPADRALRARGLGVPFEGTPGPNNAITDVPGVEVGQVTHVSGDGPLKIGTGPVRTGVTVVLPRGRASADSVYGGFFDLNGNGELTGQAYLQDFGVVIGPIGISNTNAIGQVYAGIQQWTQEKFKLAATPVVAETWDGRLNDIGGFHVQPADAIAAIEAARTGPVAEGNVGGGTGMVCFGFKGGIGTASRKVSIEGKDYVVGVLVQCNTGDRETLRIAGAPVGPELASTWLPCYDAALSVPDKQPKCKTEAAGGSVRDSAGNADAAGEVARNFAGTADEAGKAVRGSAGNVDIARGAAVRAAAADAAGHAPPDVGSIIIVVATNAPLLPVQLNRIARRAALGMGRLGSYAGNQSGDLMMSFTTSSAAADDPDQQHPSAITPLASDRLDPLFKAVVEATEESVVNALVAAQTMTGADGYRFYGLPHTQLRAILKRYGRLEGGHAP
jgi:D-aminopeptidase